MTGWFPVWFHVVSIKGKSMIKKFFRRRRVLCRWMLGKKKCGCRGNCGREDDARIASILARLEIVEHRLDDSMNMVGSMDASEFLNRFQMLEDKVDELDSKIKKAKKEN